jgi:hypothetical protein
MLLNQLTQAQTYRELQQALKAAKAEGYEISCKLNAKKETLEAARNTLVEQINQAIRETQPATTELWMPAINPDGEQFKLGDYVHLYGAKQYELLQSIAVAQAVEQNSLYRSLYTRAVELGIMDRDPGFSGGAIAA